MSMAGKFSRHPAMRQLSRWQWELLEELMFVDPVYGPLVVSAGFQSDLASIRLLREICRWMLLLGLTALVLGAGDWMGELAWIALALGVAAMGIYGLLAGYGVRMALVHDWLYRSGHLSRAAADAVLYRAATTGDGMACWRAALFWLGVRLGGHWSYARPSR